MYASVPRRHGNQQSNWHSDEAQWRVTDRWCSSGHLRFPTEVAAASHRSREFLVCSCLVCVCVCVPIRAEVSHRVGNYPYEEHKRALRQRRGRKCSDCELTWEREIRHHMQALEDALEGRCFEATLVNTVLVHDGLHGWMNFYNVWARPACKRVFLCVCVCKVTGPSAASCSSMTGPWSTAGGSDLALKEIVMGMSESYYYAASSSPCRCSRCSQSKAYMLFLISATAWE